MDQSIQMLTRTHVFNVHSQSSAQVPAQEDVKAERPSRGRATLPSYPHACRERELLKMK